MSKYKKVSIYIMFIVAFVLLLGVTYSFFNYTRTGSLNNLGTGRINFNSEQRGTFNITNAFPIKSSELENVNLDEITIEIEGDTNYSGGEEFEVKIVEVSNVVSGKRLPITYIASYEAKENKTIGSPSEDYWNEREAKDSNIYLLNETGEVIGNKQILVGYIKNDNEGINGILTIKAYIDGDKIAISDTFGNHEYIVNKNMSSEALSYCLSYFDYATEDYCHGVEKIYGSTLQDVVDNDELEQQVLEDLTAHGVLIKINYTNETTPEWVNGRVVFTTEEWNSFTESENQISFKIRVESNEGIWASIEEAPSSCFSYEINPVYARNENMSVSTCVSILTNEGFNNDLLDGETLEAFCSGTGTLNGGDFDTYLNSNHLFDMIIDQLESNEIIIKIGNEATIKDYDVTCGENVVIPHTVPVVNREFSANPNMDVNHCVSVFTDMGFNDYLENGETLETFCNGNGTLNRMTLQQVLNAGYFYDDEISTLLDENIITETVSQVMDATVVEIGLGRDYPGFDHKNLKSVLIPNTVKTINSYAFSGNKLNNVTIPNSVVSIGISAFSSNQLQSITIPSGITTIENNTFANNKIKSVTIPSNITTINSYAFSDNDITNIVLPNTLNNIGSGVFTNNDNLSSITINMNSIITDDGILHACNGSFLDYIGLQNVTSVTLGNDVKTIGECAFYNEGLTTFTIPGGVTLIGELAFTHNALTSIIIPESVEKIGESAFSENNLTSVTLYEGIKKIENNAFYGNPIASITIPSSINSIGNYAFGGNSNNKSITINKTCSEIKTMTYYPWDSTANLSGTTIYGLNNEICDSW